ncbi:MULTISPECIES: LPXTG cell wall anchor domain-containing protein [unclassified Arthrobacter]|uniref:LPXTG cell wall anchor domain-containing protein n=1 Tax=unclassified Arthrobacter TaxID=235627 RepID=UPI00159DC663|nr:MULTISPECIES: LPXTG cell wall anchor domain-containing protein [unclassified Arthrobacter]MCQ9165405.1 LPXTG cell wall anchor domain-containing protein [Arthrobacter sp. STN4]NVM99578.1 LPXTG cell wall anchor domain-containing protein [Arthrobacter sp. SDTb3-6]
MYKKSAFLVAPALALAALTMSGAGAMAADGGTTTYQANLGAVNGSHASGTVMISLTGDQATVTENVSGLAATFNGAPYPHVQHIHIDGMGTCPTAAADTNKDGVISTTEGGASYGKIGTTLSSSGDTSDKAALDLKVAGMGASYNYQRTFTMNAATIAALKAGTGVVVVHGLDPATLPAAAQKEKSDLVPSLPLAATSPALCGTVVASQMAAMPGGAPGTGLVQTAAQTGASTSPDLGLMAGAGALVVAAGAFVALRRKKTASN